MVIILAKIYKVVSEMSYSVDFRRKVLAIREKEGLSLAKVAKRFDVGLNSVMRWSKNVEAKTTRNKPSTRVDMEALKRDIEQHPDAYQYERAARLGVSRNGIWHALKRLKVSYKKKPTTPESQSRKAIYVLPGNSKI